MLGYLMTFMAGSLTGAVTMTFLIACRKQGEVMDCAGGYREQNSKSGNQHNEADSEDGNISSTDVSETPEGSENTEGTGEADREADG